MGLQGAGQAVGGRPRQPGPRRQGRQADRPLGYRIQYGDSLVQHADSARLAHVLILPSHMVRRQPWRSPPWRMARRLPVRRPGRTEAAMGRTLAEKVWDAHVVRRAEGEPDLLYIDRHLVHEVTSPQAFEGLRLAGRRVRRPEATFAVLDHNVPTTGRGLPIRDANSALQVATLERNAAECGITLFGMSDIRQGIVHVTAPEQGITLPGMTIVCGDSHTATHGAFGALAFGIGTSEVEHVLATQCLQQDRPRTMEVRVVGDLPVGSTAKDLM